MINWTELISALGALIAAIASLINRKKIQELHLLVNSRLTQLLDVTKSSAHAQGVKEGESSGRA
jgi:hypothetical protein